MISVLRIKNTKFIEGFIDGINRLLPQLTSSDKNLSITKSELQEALRNPNFYLLIAKDLSQKYPKNFVGMGSIFFQRNLGRWTSEIHDIVVDKNFRKHGVGTKIVIELVNIAKDFARQKKSKIKLYLTSRPSRVEANKLYLKIGFVKVAQATGEWGTNLYKMMIYP